MRQASCVACAAGSTVAAHLPRRLSAWRWGAALGAVGQGSGLDRRRAPSTNYAAPLHHRPEAIGTAELQTAALRQLDAFRDLSSSLAHDDAAADMA
jgi:hypothetical protein